MKMLLMLATNLCIVSAANSQWLPTAGGTMTGQLTISPGTMIQSPYYGYSDPYPQPATSGNVATFANSTTGTLDNVGWYNGWRFIKSGVPNYNDATVAFKIDPDGNAEAAGSIRTGWGPQTFFSSGSYLRIGHTSQSNLPYISFNAWLSDSPVPVGENKFNPIYSDGSGLIIAGEAGRSTIRFLQHKYNSLSTPVTMSTFKQTLSINEWGEVGVGMPGLDHTGYSLAVNGDLAAKRVRVTQGSSGQWPDYVFDPSYKLLPLDSVAAFIDANKHLPEVPSTKQVEKDGLDIADQQALLLKKIEELTLYIIQLKDQQNTTNQKQQILIEKQAKEIELLKSKIDLN